MYYFHFSFLISHYNFPTNTIPRYTASSILLFRYISLLLTSFTVPNVYGGNGITLGTAAAQVGDAGDVWTALGVYAPTLPEVVVFAGVVCAGALAYMILSKCVLPKCGGEQ